MRAVLLALAGLAIGGSAHAQVITGGDTRNDVAAQISAALAPLQAQIGSPYTDARAAAASPVQSVNGAVGAVSVPAQQYQRIQDMAVPTSGTLTWTFPVPFNKLPSCYRDLASTATGYTFDDPLRVAVSTTSVTYKVTAHPTSVQITSLSLPITLPLTSSTVPGGTTLSLTCTAPL